MNFGSPLLLSSLATLGFNNNTVLFPTNRLQAPNREALAVSELRFYLGYVDLNWRNMAREVRVSISVGNWKICDNFPIWAMNPIRSRSMENFAGYRIKLRRPFFIPPGVAITAYAKRFPDPLAGSPYPAANVPLYMTGPARVVTSDFPRTTNVPYLASYCPDGMLQVGVGTGGTFFSGIGDLKNESDQDIELEYLVGKLGSLEVIRIGGVFCNVIDHFEPEFHAPMRLSYDGYEIAPEGTDFAGVFEPNTRSLNMGRTVMEKGKRLMFSMPVPFSAAGTYYWAPTLGFLSSRQEVLK